MIDVDAHLLLTAGEIRDALGTKARPGAVWLRPDRSVAACGSPEVVRGLLDNWRRDVASDVEEIHRPDAIVIPALVNAHAHLDLTHIGPRQYDGDFVEWVTSIRPLRADDDVGIASSVQSGIDLALAGGTALIGDIAGQGSLIPARVLSKSRLRGASFIEFFGHGEFAQPIIPRMHEIERLTSEWSEPGRFRMGLQPHAPYSAGIELYQAASDISKRCHMPLATHLAETQEELEFIESGGGKFAELIRSIGKWDDSIIAHHAHPIDYLASILKSSTASGGGWTVAHVNYLNDTHFKVLANAPVTVAYCPRASAYFKHQLHRYREMLKHDVRVALGTDSMVCLDTPDRLSILDEMRFLMQRDGTDANVLLRMATVNGATALGFDPALVSFHPTPEHAPHPIAGMIALPVDRCEDRDALAEALALDEPFESIMFPPN